MPSHDLSRLNKTRRSIEQMTDKAETLAAHINMMRPDYRHPDFLGTDADVAVALTAALCELECVRANLTRCYGMLAEAENRIAALAEAQEVARG